MKILRFSVPSTKIIRYGILKNGQIYPVAGPIFGKHLISKTKPYDLTSAKIFSPSEPTKIVLVGLNYRDHAKELKMKIPKEPIIFMKPPTAVIGHLGKIIYPKNVKRLDYEAELAIVIKKTCRNVKKVHARDFILGYTCLNDITARDIQGKDGQWTRSKSYDTFCPIGPVIETDLDASNVRVRLFLNNVLKQSSSTKNLIFSVNALVSFVSGVMTLMPGDIISTGTPPGVGSMKRGDTVRVEIERIGSLVNRVV